MKNCVFCSVVNSNDPHHEIIWQDEKHIAFLDINPSKTGHALVIPKKHSESHLDMSPEEYSELFVAARSVSKLLKEKLNSYLISLVVEGISVPHTHIHLIPLKEGEELATFENFRPAPEELKEVADLIRAV